MTPTAEADDTETPSATADTAADPTFTATVVGGSGFAGGELLRLLASHPNFDLVAATSREYAGKSLGYVHPNLRHHSLRFSTPDDLGTSDVLFAATPHGVTMEHIEAFQDTADLVVDLSADFRLPDAAAYDEWYDGHSAPEYLDDAVYGLVELTREELTGAELIATGGCNATVAMLALAPLIDAGILDDDRIVVDLKVGSSEGGAGGGPASSHAERSGVVRPYAPTGHRHEAELAAYLDCSVSLTAHAVDMVRGAAVTCHCFPDEAVSTSDCWTAYREAYEDEPFIRLVGGGGAVYRYPEAKTVAGSNVAEIGFELDSENGRLVVFGAIDNVTKGAAGQAVHAANVALGLDETAGLAGHGLHPVGSP